MGAPELHRSGHTEVDPKHAAEVAERRNLRPGPDEHGVEPVPPGNRPGHRPRADQDKPTGPPPARTRGARRRFDLAFAGPFELVDRLLQVRPDTAYVELGEEDLIIRFGHWTLRTTIDNVRDVSVTGPYAWWKTIGPPRLSVKDRGITFATTASRGVCISFAETVPAALPIAWLRHPAATVTVADPEALVEALEQARQRGA